MFSSGKLSVKEEYGEAIDAYYLHIFEAVVERIGIEPNVNDSFKTGYMLSPALYHILLYLFVH